MRQRESKPFRGIIRPINDLHMQIERIASSVNRSNIGEAPYRFGNGQWGYPAVEAGILPLNYSRVLSNQLFS